MLRQRAQIPNMNILLSRARWLFHRRVLSGFQSEPSITNPTLSEYHHFCSCTSWRMLILASRELSMWVWGWLFYRAWRVSMRLFRERKLSKREKPEINSKTACARTLTVVEENVDQLHISMSERQHANQAKRTGLLTTRFRHTFLKNTVYIELPQSRASVRWLGRPATFMERLQEALLPPQKRADSRRNAP